MRWTFVVIALLFVVPCHAGEKGITGGLDGPDRNALLRELGVDFVRFGVAWDTLEPTPGQYRWAVYDQMLADLSRNLPGVALLVTIRVRATGADSLPADLPRFCTWVRLMAEHGRGRVAAYQVGNEVDWKGGWTGSAAQYVQLLRAASAAIRAGDPNAKVVMAGFTSDGLMISTMLAQHRTLAEIARYLGKSSLSGVKQWDATIREILRNGRQYVDAVDAHLYHSCATIPARIAWLRQAAQREVWVTETGGPDSIVCEWSEAAQAEEARERVAAAFGAGATRVAWLGLYEMVQEATRFRQMGLVDRTGRRKAAFYAWAQ